MKESLVTRGETAWLSDWMLVIVEGESCLFGFAAHHPVTGGLSWLLSTKVVELEEARSHAHTASGRFYRLGRKVTVSELDDEGRLAFRLLVTHRGLTGPERTSGVAWLCARKMARHLRVAEPPLGQDAEIELFLAQYGTRYARLRTAQLKH